MLRWLLLSIVSPLLLVTAATAAILHSNVSQITLANNNPLLKLLHKWLAINSVWLYLSVISYFAK
ncbi:MAG: hypothetical protein CML20_00415 [Rheinheimera sp.]|nr:hypothetical protein [Rheinheimera sp.]